MSEKKTSKITAKQKAADKAAKAKDAAASLVATTRPASLKTYIETAFDGTAKSIRAALKELAYNERILTRALAKVAQAKKE